VTWLDDMVPPPVHLARDGELARPGVALAPEGAHLTLGDDGRLHLDHDSQDSTHCPSADVLFGSLARHAGRGAVVAVLTGMGRDGAAGVTAVRAAGGVAFTEHAEDATIWGMPAAATAAGAQPLALVEVARTLAKLTAGSRR